MARIRYIAYSLNDPERCLGKEQYDIIAALSDSEFGTFLGEMTGQAWSKFRQEHSHLFRPAYLLIFAVVFLGIVTHLCDEAGKKGLTEFFGFGFMMGALALLGVGSSLGMSAASHSHYVRNLKAYFVRQRIKIIKSFSYE
jgi:dipeptide/tripeptide permease